MQEISVAALACERREVTLSYEALGTIVRSLVALLEDQREPETLRERGRVVLAYRLLGRMRQRLLSPRKSYRMGFGWDELLVLQPVLESLSGYAGATTGVGVYEASVGSDTMMQLRLT